MAQIGKEMTKIYEEQLLIPDKNLSPTQTISHNDFRPYAAKSAADVTPSKEIGGHG